MLSTAGADPVAAEPAYRLPSPLISAGQIAAAALRLERRCATAYAALVAATGSGSRTWAVDALVETAASEGAFGGSPEALPGLEPR
jgi:hypothetical protein